MSNPSDPLAWVARAEEDFAAVELGLRQEPPLTYIVCFHAQQCAEKYLKAILVAQQYVVPKIHDLLTLQDLCKEASILVEMAPDRLSLLSSYAVKARYPGEDPMLEEAREAAQTARTVRNLARQLLGLGNSDGDEAA